MLAIRPEGADLAVESVLGILNGLVGTQVHDQRLAELNHSEGLATPQHAGVETILGKQQRCMRRERAATLEVLG